MDFDKVHLRPVMLFKFREGKNATAAAIEICEVEGAGVISERTCRKWFARFREGNFDLTDGERQGRPRKVKSRVLQDVLDDDPSRSQLEMTEVMVVDQNTDLFVYTNLD